MNNMGSIIRTHNNKVLNESRSNVRECNCRNVNECPADGKCLQSSIVYKATVEEENMEDKIYYGMTKNSFMQRFNGIWEHLGTENMNMKPL